MKYKKECYFTLATLIKLFQGYAYNGSVENGQKIIQYIEQYITGKELPLPNGQYGDALDLAEMMGFDDVVRLLQAYESKERLQSFFPAKCLVEDRQAYLRFATLVFYLRRYVRDSSQVHEEDLLQFVRTIGNAWMPLPSGYYGNALAVAVEMQLYAGAFLLLEHHDQLDLDTEVVAINDFGETMSIENSFDFSLSYLPSDIGMLNHQCNNPKQCRTISNIKWIDDIKNFLLNDKIHTLSN